MESIRYYNRHREEYEIEEIYGESFLRWIYGHPIGKLALHALVKRACFSRWYGMRMNAAQSSQRVAPFVEKYGLNADEFRDPLSAFRSFNEFFYRRLKPEARPIDAANHSVVFPADGRHLGFERASQIRSVFVKGQSFDLEKLLGDAQLAAKYADGSLVLSRLCPLDYHRFHFPAAGIPSQTRLISGPLFSVNPLALRRNLAYLWTNQRAITLLETETLGTVVLLEIGATCVGSIQQTYAAGKLVRKGDEKGYFAFGGSSTIVIFEPNRVVLDEDLLSHSQMQTELYALQGSHMGKMFPR